MPILQRNPNSTFPVKRLLPLLALLVLTLMLASGLFNGDEKKHSHSRMLGYTLRDFQIPSLLDGGIISPQGWRGKIVLVNFFASWCEQCVTEHPVMMRLSQTSKVEMVGIAWRDKPEKTRQWLVDHGNPYHHVGIDEKTSTTITFGLTGVPETYIIDPKGVIVYHHNTPITDEVIDNEILPKIAELQEKYASGAD